MQVEISMKQVSYVDGAGENAFSRNVSADGTESRP